MEDLLRLHKAAQKISSILDLDELIDKVVNDVARSFGCVEANIYLHEEERGELALAGVCGCTVYHKGHSLKIGKEGMAGYVAATKQMRYAADVRKDEYYISCEETTLSEVAIPLLVEGKLVGVFSASHPELDAFPPEQLRLLQALCVHIAVAINNARRFQHERNQRQKMIHEVHEARAIQQGLFPKSSPYIPGFAISGLSIPAGAVGGDWYDFIPFPDGCWGLVLADVAGKGTGAALLMSATRGMLRSLERDMHQSGEVMDQAESAAGRGLPSGRFVTMLCSAESEQRTLTFASAATCVRFWSMDMALGSWIRNGVFRWGWDSATSRKVKFIFRKAHGWCSTAMALPRRRARMAKRVWSGAVAEASSAAGCFHGKIPKTCANRQQRRAAMTLVIFEG